LAQETIEELREENERLQRELDSMTISRNSYMKENAEMKKQLAWYKKQMQKAEKASA
jgi:FtsZ-binding cell division protein ZapB